MYVSRHEKASAGGGLFAQQGGLFAWQNLATCVSRTDWHAISTNLSSGWFYQDQRACQESKTLSVDIFRLDSVATKKAVKTHTILNSVLKVNVVKNFAIKKTS